MKSRNQFFPTVAFRTLALLALTLPTLTDTRAAETANATAPKDHQLFIGLNVLVTADGRIGRVRSVSSRAAEIAIGDGVERIPMRGLVTHRFEHVTKVSTEQVKIEKIRDGRLTDALDPNMRDVVIDQAAEEIQREQQERLQKEDQIFQQAVYDPKENQAEINAEYARREMMERAMAEAPNAQMDLFSRDMFLDLEHWESAGEYGNETLQISFEITAPRPISDAYATIFVATSTRADRPFPLHRVIMRKLPSIGPRPTTIRISQPGMPTGFILESYEIHIYSQDRELGSNVAQGSVALTRDEAIKFMHLRYLVDHAGASRPPQLMPNLLPASDAARLPANQLKRKVTVKTNPAGDVTAVVLERTRDTRADADLETLVRNSVFFPALNEGKAVAGEVSLPLSAFVK